eukprot:TRINITY_DN73969_c0_g1_i1.p1 TRINITY_DN73969_c0_g1~~TRINITY_DN73969_c0_g1_i1.p1  ORF type:complete len:188 (+),score=23.73 TRINITY_DN73969_c0_g1_i1:90-653(+)
MESLLRLEMLADEAQPFMAPGFSSASYIWSRLSLALSLTLLMVYLGMVESCAAFACDLLWQPFRKTLPISLMKQRLRRILQRRRLYCHWAQSRWEDYTRWEESIGQCLLASVPWIGYHQRTLPLRRCSGGKHGLFGFHRVQGTDFLLQTEVAACRFPAEVSEHLQRLLGERCAKADEPESSMPPIKE